MVKTPHFHYRGLGFNPWLGSQDSASCVMQAKEKKKKKETTVEKMIVYFIALLIIRHNKAVYVSFWFELQFLFLLCRDLHTYTQPSVLILKIEPHNVSSKVKNLILEK